MPTNTDLLRKRKLALLTELESIKHLLENERPRHDPPGNKPPNHSFNNIHILQDAIIEKVVDSTSISYMTDSLCKQPSSKYSLAHHVKTGNTNVPPEILPAQVLKFC